MKFDENLKKMVLRYYGLNSHPYGATFWDKVLSRGKPYPTTSSE